MTTWRELITIELKYHNDSFEKCQECVWGMAKALPFEDEITTKSATFDEFLDREFDGGYGLPEGEPFTLWTETRVYFPVVYDGAESVRSVPIHQTGEVTNHIGGY